MKLITLATALLIIQTAAFSNTIYVPDDFATIQQAVDAASSGDTVIVRPGTYLENIDFVQKAITVKSESGPAATIIDGNQNATVVTFQSGEGADSVLEGFTLTNGLGEDLSPNFVSGGAITCENSSSPTIIKNIVEDNHAEFGGGIACANGSAPTITQNIIQRNTADLGGGIYCDESTPLIGRNVISENTAQSRGGGLYLREASPTITDNSIERNTVPGIGGHGAGICCWNNCSPTISNNIIHGNCCLQPGSEGGGIYCSWYGYPDITSNRITANSAIWNGGGIYLNFSRPTLVNNTICFNSAGQDGGGLYCMQTPMSPWPLEVANTIFWGNSAVDDGPELYVDYEAELSIHHCDVQDPQSSIFVGSSCTFNWGGGMIDADPFFADPAVDDFHIGWNSPCRNTGINSAVAESTDFEGDPRVAIGRVDMGADEFYYHLYQVGIVSPGFNIDIKVAGYPSAPVVLYLGSGLADPPHSTQHGDFFLNWPPLWHGKVGTIPAEGILTFPATVPSGWASGSEHPFQSLVGPWGGAYTRLSNAMVLTVE